MIRFEVVALLVRIFAAVCILSVMACSQQRPAPVAQTDAEGLAGQGYVVRPGDTLSIIAAFGRSDLILLVQTPGSNAGSNSRGCEQLIP